MLTINEYAILRTLERSPGLTRWGIYTALAETPFAVSANGVYRGIATLWGFAAIEIEREEIGRNGSPVRYYVLSDAGRESLAELRSFFEVPA